MKIKHHFFIVVALIVAFYATASSASAATTERVSLNNSGVQGNNFSYSPAVSSDGRYVAFYSVSSNLVAGDTNVANDIFVYDRTTDTIERVSISNGGTQGNNQSIAPSISDDGRYVAFQSMSDNLVPNDNNYMTDIFVYDRQTDTIERVSLDSLGNEADSGSLRPSISSNGQFIAFYSSATNLVVGDTNGANDVFVYNRTTDTIERVSLTSGGVEGNSGSYDASISDNGQFVAFSSGATNLVASDTNSTTDIFVYDRTADTVERVSLTSGGVQGNSFSESASISSDGRYIAFHSNASNLVAGDTNNAYDIFVYDRQTDAVERVSLTSGGVQGNGASQYTAISADGRYVVFTSEATNLVAADTNAVADIFRYDRNTDTVVRANVSSAGVQANGGSTVPSSLAISNDGKIVAFYSDATNLVSGDTNAQADVFVRDLTVMVRVQPAKVEALSASVSDAGLTGEKVSAKAETEVKQVLVTEKIQN